MATDVIPALAVKEFRTDSLDLNSSTKITSVSTGAADNDKAVTKGYVDDASTPYIRTSQVYQFPAKLGVNGTGAGYTNANNQGIVTLPASTGASHWIIPITGLHVGDTITAMRITGQLASAGNNNVLDADLRTATATAGGSADATIGAITQLIKTADYKINDTVTGLSYLVYSGSNYYVLITGTTLAVTDQEIVAVEITVTTS